MEETIFESSPDTSDFSKTPPKTYFLLVSPVEVPTQMQLPQPQASTHNGRFVSRFSDRAQVLNYALATSSSSSVKSTRDVSSKGTATLEATESWIADFGETKIVAVLCTAHTPNIDTLSVTELNELEIALTDIGTKAVVAEIGCSRESVKWVGRNLLLEAGAKVADGWLASDIANRPLDGLPDSYIKSGWGNGVLVGWDLLDEKGRIGAICGFIDAQYLWHQTDKLSRRSLEILQNLGPPQARVRAREVRRMQRQMEHEWTKMANHHLATDDLVMNVQGIRKTVAQANLDGWNYTDAIARISRRMEDTGNVVNRKTARLERRYQSTVELILFALGLLTFVEIVLSAISTAYSGTVNAAPGDEIFGLFSWIRSTSADALVLSAFAMVLVAAALVIFRRKS